MINTVEIPFDRSLDAPYSVVVELSSRIARLLAPNPSLFTFKGTGVHIVGERDVAVIDPGPNLPGHVEALKCALVGRRVSHILVTHTHLDHSPAAVELKRWSGALTYGFGPHRSGEDSDAEEGADRDFVPDRRVKDSDVIAGEGFTFDCIHTPGHTANHVCYALREEKALFTGDHVMGWSTSVIAPPDGNMTDYIASLEKLLARDDAVLYPTHGSPIENPRIFLRAYLNHRHAREAQILALLADGVKTIPAMVMRLYSGVDLRLHSAAAHTVLAHLMKLNEEGRVAAGPDGRYRLESALR